MLAPIIIFVYNRPNHTIKMIESLAKNYLAKDSDVYIFSDGPKNANSKEDVDKVQKYIDSISENNYFHSVTIEKSTQNKGLANSVIYGVSKIIKLRKKAIILEDDLITSLNFLTFMNDALNYYENDYRIWSISGFNIPIDIPTDYKDDVYLSYRGSSWGWATWYDRWSRVDWRVSDYPTFKKSKKSRLKFNRGGRDLSDMLDMQMLGEIDSWAIRWCYQQSKENMYTIYPVQSFVKNIGLDGSGTHSGSSKKYNVIKNNKDFNYKLSSPQLNNKILKSFKNHYMNYLKYLLTRPKRAIKIMLRK